MVSSILLPTTTFQGVIDYAAEKSKIRPIDIGCFALISKKNNIETMRTINFKIGVSLEYTTIVFNSNFWPDGVQIREFLHNQKNSTTLTHVNNT